MILNSKIKSRKGGKSGAEPDRTHYLNVGDTSLAFREYGSGFPLIMVNGVVATMDTWNPRVLQRLAERYRVIVFNYRSAGHAGSPEKTCTIPRFARDVVQIMDGLGIARAHVLGFSMGASVAQELALAHPDRVAKLILVAGTCGGREAVATPDAIWDKLLDRSGSPLDVADRMFSLIFPAGWLGSHDPWSYCPDVREATGPEDAACQVRAFRSWPGSYDRLHRIRSPTLVLAGLEDGVIDPENSGIISRQIPGAELVTFPGAGHGLMYQIPDRFCDAVMGFLNR